LQGSAGPPSHRRPRRPHPRQLARPIQATGHAELRDCGLIATGADPVPCVLGEGVLARCEDAGAIDLPTTIRAQPGERPSDEEARPHLADRA
jgi:hypothetical protein